MPFKKAARPKPPPAPVCPACSTDDEPVTMLPWHGRHQWRCPRCLLAHLAPVPKPEELPALERCPECAKQARIQRLVRLDYGWNWCRACGYSIQIKTEAQHAAGETVTRRIVGGCYGDPTLHPAKRHGGSRGAKGGRSRKKSGGGRVTNMKPYSRIGPGGRR